MLSGSRFGINIFDHSPYLINSNQIKNKLIESISYDEMKVPRFNNTSVNFYHTVNEIIIKFISNNFIIRDQFIFKIYRANYSAFISI
jgi:hypothetical protein